MSSMERLALMAVEQALGVTVYRSRKPLIDLLLEHFLRGMDPAELERKQTRRELRLDLASLFDRSIVPDGWAFIPRKGHETSKVIAIEVEDTHKLTTDKLLGYGSMWWAFDGDDELELELLVTDRYGHGLRYFNMPALGHWAVSLESEDEENLTRELQEVIAVFGPLVRDASLGGTA